MSKTGGHRRVYVGFRGLWEGSQAELTSRDNALVCAELMFSARVLGCLPCGKLPCLNPGLLRSSQQSHRVRQFSASELMSQKQRHWISKGKIWETAEHCKWVLIKKLQAYLQRLDTATQKDG